MKSILLNGRRLLVLVLFMISVIALLKGDHGILFMCLIAGINIAITGPQIHNNPSHSFGYRSHAELLVGRSIALLRGFTGILFLMGAVSGYYSRDYTASTFVLVLSLILFSPFSSLIFYQSGYFIRRAEDHKRVESYNTWFIVARNTGVILLFVAIGIYLDGSIPTSFVLFTVGLLLVLSVPVLLVLKRNLLVTSPSLAGLLVNQEQYRSFLMKDLFAWKSVETRIAEVATEFAYTAPVGAVNLQDAIKPVTGNNGSTGFVHAEANFAGAITNVETEFANVKPAFTKGVSDFPDAKSDVVKAAEECAVVSSNDDQPDFDNTVSDSAKVKIDATETNLRFSDSSSNNTNASKDSAAGSPVDSSFIAPAPISTIPEIAQPAQTPLLDQFNQLASLDAQKRGYEFQKFLITLFNHSSLDAKSAFRVVGEEIDGSFELDGNIYLLEAKWQSNPCSGVELRDFNGKVEGKASWARGIIVCYSGFSSDAITGFITGKRLNIIGMDGNDIRLVLEGKISLKDAIRRKVRLAGEKNSFFVPVSKLCE